MTPKDGKWRKVVDRVYERNTEHTQSFVFGTTPPVRLWAWAVFYGSSSPLGVGSSASVEHGFDTAKKRAEEHARMVEP